MDKTRSEFLAEALKVNPDDTFARYALALELSNCGHADEAWQHFEYLLKNHPEYSATYYQAGTFLARRGRREEAQKILAQGIEVTQRQGNRHAESELQAALEDLRSVD